MSTAVPPRPAPNKLPVWEAAKETYARVFDNPRLLVRASLVPYSLSLALAALSLAVPVDWVFGSLIGLLSLLPIAIFGVAWHRLTLLGPEAGAPPLMSGWGRRQWRFFGYSAAVMLIGTGVMMAVSLLGFFVIPASLLAVTGTIYVIMFIAAAVFAYFIIRLSFVFPAVSVDEKYTLRHAWIHTKGQGLRLLGAMTIAAAPLFALAWGTDEILRALLFAEPLATPGQDALPPAEQMQALIDANQGAHMLIQAIGNVIGYIDMALMVSVISIAFRTCTGWVSAPSSVPSGNDGSS